MSFAVSRLLDDWQGPELASSDFPKSDGHPRFERILEVQSAAKQLPSFGGLGRIKPVQRAVVTPTAFVGRMRAELRVAKLRSAQARVDQEAQGGPLGPLPAA